MSTFTAERLQRSIALTARLMMGRDVQITHRGAKAFVAWDKNYNISRINLPCIPSDASPRLVAALQGYLDHEVGHVFNTDPELYADAGPQARKHGLNEKTAAFLTNVIEDTFIERRIRDEFPGARYNLDQVLKVVLEDIMAPKLAKLSTDMERRSMAIMPFFRARAGDAPARDFMDAHGLWPLMEVFDKAVPDLENRLKSIRRSDHSVTLAIEIMKAVSEHLKEPPPEEGEGDEDGDPSEKSEKSKKAKSKKSKGEGEDKKEKDEKKGKKSKPEKKEEADEGEDGDPADEGDEGEDEGEGEEEGSDGGAGDAEGEGDPLDALINGECGMDFDSAAEKAIEGMVINAMSKDPIRDFTKDFDRIEPARIAKNADPAPIQDQVDKTAAPMMKDIQRLIAARTLSIRTPGFKSGKLHAPSLHRAVAGDDRLFSRKHENRTKDVAVSLVVDLSGSMGGDKIKVAIESAWAFSEVLSRLKITNEVIGFTTDGEGFSRIQRDASVQKEYRDFVASGGPARLEPVYMPIYKDFNEPFGPTQKKRLASALQGSTNILANNLDGHSVRYAAMRLLPRKEARKIMIVFSDGYPAASVHGDLNKDLKDSIKLLSQSKIEVIGIGIKSAAVKEFYPRWVVIQRSEELVGTVMTKLRELLTPV